MTENRFRSIIRVRDEREIFFDLMNLSPNLDISYNPHIGFE